jgi:hypothetical protein
VKIPARVLFMTFKLIMITMNMPICKWHEWESFHKVYAEMTHDQEGSNALEWALVIILACHCTTNKHDKKAEHHCRKRRSSVQVVPALPVSLNNPVSVHSRFCQDTIVFTISRNQIRILDKDEVRMYWTLTLRKDEMLPGTRTPKLICTIQIPFL